MFFFLGWHSTTVELVTDSNKGFFGGETRKLPRIVKKYLARSTCEQVLLKQQYLLRTLLWSLLSFVSNSQYLRRHGTVRFARPVGASASKTKGPLKSGDLKSVSYAICIASLKATALAVSNGIKNS